MIPNITSTDGVIKMKGTAVCSGKIKGRACVAMTIEEAQNIQVIHFHILLLLNIITFV